MTNRRRTREKQRAPKRPGRGRAGRRSPSRTGPLVAVAAVAVVIVAMALAAALRKPATNQGSSPAGAAAQTVQHVPLATLDAVGAGTGVTPPMALASGTPPLEQDGKPEILYVGAEYCPYCAAQRWPLIVALSRFGTFSDLGATESAAGDIYPSTQTFTFHGSTYASAYVTFTPVETNTNQLSPSGTGYEPLEQLTPDQQNLVARFDQPPYTSQAGAIPFLMIGNRFVAVGASYEPGILRGMTREQIAAALFDPTGPVARSIDGSANTLTADICELTSGQPREVCSDPLIAKLMSTQQAAP
jgi:hypothetical protein